MYHALCTLHGCWSNCVIRKWMRVFWNNHMLQWKKPTTRLFMLCTFNLYIEAMLVSIMDIFKITIYKGCKKNKVACILKLFSAKYFFRQLSCKNAFSTVLHFLYKKLCWYSYKIWFFTINHFKIKACHVMCDAQIQKNRYLMMKKWKKTNFF